MDPCSKSNEIDHLQEGHQSIMERMREGDKLFVEFGGKLDTLVDMNTEAKIERATINKRLFIDNGTKSHQTILNEHETIIKVVVWLAGVSVSGMTILVINALWGLIKGS